MEDNTNKKPGEIKSSQSSPMSNMQNRNPISNMQNRNSQPDRTRLNSNISAEEKLKRSLKGLSHTNGGSGGLNLNSSSSLNYSKSRLKDNAQTTRKKVGGVVLDLDTIEDATRQKLDSKSKGRRKNVIILVLSLLLVVSIVYLIIALIAYKHNQKERNLKYYVEGNVSAEWIIEGGSQTEFLIGKDLYADTMLNINSKLRIKSDEIVELELEIKVYLNGEHLVISGVQGLNNDLKQVAGRGNVYVGDVAGGVITVFEALDFSDAPPELNSENVTIDIIVRVNKKV